jgi:hypothetical protein
MNFTKNSLVLLLLVLATVAHAQTAQQQALNEAGLTATEIEAIQTADQNFKEAAKTVRKDATLDRPAKGKKLRALQQERKAEIKAIMGEERYVEYQKVVAEKRAERKTERDAAMTELNLTTEQEADLKAVNEKYKQAAQAVRQDTNLTKEQKKQQANELRQSHLADMRAVLTAEQYEQYRAMKKAKRQ